MVHSHGLETGDHERMIVCLLGSTGAIPAAMAFQAIQAALETMNGYAPDRRIEPVPGGIRFNLGRTTHAVAHEMATTLWEVLNRTQEELLPEDSGVGVSVKVIAFPDAKGVV